MWTAHSNWCANRFDNCSLYMCSSSAMVSWNKCRWRSYWWHLGDASTTYTCSASAARRTAATSGSSGSRLWLRGGTLVGRQSRLSWRRSAWVHIPFLTGRVEERPVGRPAVGVRQRRRHQPATSAARRSTEARLECSASPTCSCTAASASCGTSTATAVAPSPVCWAHARGCATANDLRLSLFHY